MATSQAAELKPPVRRYVFTEENTIGDLFKLVNELELEGKPPFLKFLGTRGAIVAVEVLVHDPEPPVEMAVYVTEEDVPDPAEPSIRDQVVAAVNGNRARTGLSPYESDPRD